MNRLFELKFGSHLYGTDTPNSDLDLKGIYLPEPREIVLNTYQKTISSKRKKSLNERNTKDDVDLEYFSLDRYLKLLTEGQTVALDILFAGSEMYTYLNDKDYWIFSNIYNNRTKLISKDITAFMGYASQQANKYGLKGFRVAAFRDALEFLSKFKDHQRLSDESVYPELMKFVYERPCANPTPKTKYITIEERPNNKGQMDKFLQVADKFYSLNCIIKLTKSQVQQKFDEYGKRALLAEKNEGCDYKALSHAVRVNSQGKELLETGQITFPRPDKELLLKIKTGQMHYKDIESIILEGFDELKNAQINSKLIEKPDLQWRDDFIEEIYTNIVKGTL